MKNIFKFTNNIFAKTMLILIAISFVVVGGISGSINSDTTIAQVEGEEISTITIAGQYQQAIKNIGIKDISSQELRNLGLVQQILGQEISKKSIVVQAKALGITVSDEFVAKELKKIKAFQTLNKFDKGKFQQILAYNKITAEDFIKGLKEDLIVQRYTNAFASIKFQPKNISNAIARNYNQTRNGVKASIDIATIKVSNPTDSDLRKLYDLEKNNFAVNETRDISVLYISKDSIAKNISDTEAKTFYNKNKKLYTKPESVSFYTIGGNEEQFKKLSSAIKKGTDIKTAIKDIFKVDAKTLFTKSADKNSVDTAVKDTVFSTNVKTLSKPVDVGFGKAVIYVTAKNKAVNKSFVEAKLLIKSQLAEGKLLDIITDAEDLISSGSELNEVAKSVNIKLINIAKINASGSDKHKFSNNPAFIQKAFTTDLNEISDTIDIDENSYAFVKVNKINARHIPKLEDIKYDVKKYFLSKARTIKAQESLIKLKAVNNKDKFTKLAKSLGFKISNISGAKMNADNNLIFGANKDSVVLDLNKTKATAVLITDVNIPVSVSKNKTSEISNKINDISINSTVNTVYTYIQGEQDISVNNDAIELIYSGNK
ncbi:MAG: peptidylprolyl isomerase [Alphaproteobacteria bacterium]